MLKKQMDFKINIYEYMSIFLTEMFR